MSQPSCEADRTNSPFLYPFVRVNELDEAHTHWGGQSALFGLLISMLVPSRNTLMDTTNNSAHLAGPPVPMCMHVQPLSCVLLFVTPWTVAYQTPLSMGCPRQEFCSGLPFPSLGNLSNLGRQILYQRAT